jgi:hypothetical protein
MLGLALGGRLSRAWLEGLNVSRISELDVVLGIALGVVLGIVLIGVLSIISVIALGLVDGAFLGVALSGGLGTGLGYLFSDALVERLVGDGKLVLLVGGLAGAFVGGAVGASVSGLAIRLLVRYLKSR